MFEQSTIPKGPRRWWATGVGVGGQILLVAGLAIAPMIWPEVIPQAAFAMTLFAPGPPPPPPPPPGPAAVRPRHPTTVVRDTAFHVPSVIPDHAVIVIDPPPEVGSYGVEGGVPGGVPGGDKNGVLGAVLADFHPPNVERPPEPVKPPAPSPAPATRPERLVIPGGRVNPALPIFRPEPVYPPLAKTMRVSGVVELSRSHRDGRPHQGTESGQWTSVAGEGGIGCG
jgi:periplasmic protein TonB